MTQVKHVIIKYKCEERQWKILKNTATSVKLIKAIYASMFMLDRKRLADVFGSNSTEVMDIRLLCVLYVVG